MTLRQGGEWAEEVAYAVEHGIPLSVFKSWEVHDQEVALAYQREQRLRCGVCGTSEWMFKDDPDAYVATNDRCKGCEKVAQQQRANSEYKGRQDGIRIVLMKREAAEGSEGGDQS